MEQTKVLNVELPISVRERLIARANRNRRSMRGEALAIIEAALWHDEAVREDPDVWQYASSELAKSGRYTLHAACAWCGKDLGDKATTDPKTDGMTSHGICSECAEKMRGGDVTDG